MRVVWDPFLGGARGRKPMQYYRPLDVVVIVFGIA